MNSELFLYDRDKGLFKEIVKFSKVMQGRYFISPSKGADLNANNMDQLITGLPAEQKYPMVLCLAPQSRLVKINGQKWEQFFFNLFFLCSTYYTGQNQIKDVNVATNTSMHHVWYDWKDMKECAVNFFELLDKALKKPVLRAIANVDTERADINRLSRYNNDRVSGVSLSFSAFMAAGNCDISDYEENVIDLITIPELNIHPLHKH